VAGFSLSGTPALADGASEFSGVVVGVGGLPEAGVSVFLQGGPQGVQTYLATTGSDGSFDLLVLSGSYDVSFHDVGSSWGLNGSVDLSSSVTGQTLSLFPSSPVSFAVSDISGVPIAGATVSATTACGGAATGIQLLPAGVSLSGSAAAFGVPPPATATTDGSGAATVQVPGGFCHSTGFTVSAPGYVDVSVAAASSGTFPVTLHSVNETPSTFSGTVVDQDGHPLAGLTLGLAGLTAVTAADGSFSLSVRAGSYSLNVSGTTPDGSGRIALNTGLIDLTHSLTGQTLTVPIYPVNVVVSGPSGAPVAGISVSLIGGEGPVRTCTTSFELSPGIQASGPVFFDSPYHRVTDAAGVATVFETLPCPLLVPNGPFVIQPPAGMGYPDERVAFNNTPVTGPLTYPITLASLAGTLSGSDGSVLAGQTVALQSGGSTVTQGTTGSDGAFVVAASAGTYDVNVSGQLGDPTTYSVTVPGVDLTVGQRADLALPTETVAVHVLDSSGNPVGNATVSAPCVPTSFPLLGGTASGTECPNEATDTSGTATVVLLPTGPLTFTVTPPAGSAFAPGAVTVTPTAGSQSVNVQLAPSLSITSGSAASFTVGKAGSFKVTTKGTPTPSLSVAGLLPAGVAFTDNHDGTGTLRGTPAAGSSGVYASTVRASNGATVSQAFTLTVNGPPAFTSANATTFAIGVARSFTVRASGYPFPSLKVTGALPAGVTFKDNHDGTGTLAGTPTVKGTFKVTFGGSNSLGSASQAFALTVGTGPTIKSSASVTFTAGKAASFEVDTAGIPAPAITLAGALPPGLTFMDRGDGSGILSGIPTKGGSYPLTVTAASAAGTATQTLTVTVNQAPAFGSAPITTFATGQVGSFTVTTAAGWPTTVKLTESGKLPAGVTFVDKGNGTAALAGTPAANTVGKYTLTFTASNGQTTTQSFTLTVNQAPAFTSANTVTFPAGKGGTFAVTTTGSPTATLIAAGPLPTGITFTDNHNGTGTLTVSSKVAKGSYSSTVKATNVAATVSQVILITVK